MWHGMHVDDHAHVHLQGCRVIRQLPSSAETLCCLSLFAKLICDYTNNTMAITAFSLRYGLGSTKIYVVDADDMQRQARHTC